MCGTPRIKIYKEVLSFPCAANPVVRPSPSAILAPAPVSAIGTQLIWGQYMTSKMPHSMPGTPIIRMHRAWISHHPFLPHFCRSRPGRSERATRRFRQLGGAHVVVPHLQPEPHYLLHRGLRAQRHRLHGHRPRQPCVCVAEEGGREDRACPCSPQCSPVHPRLPCRCDSRYRRRHERDGHRTHGQHPVHLRRPVARSEQRLCLGPVQRRHGHLEYADVEGCVDHLSGRASFISQSVISHHDHQLTRNPWPQVPPPSLARWSAQTR